MPPSSSLVRRVAQGSALAASAAALLVAFATTTFSSYLIRRAEDRRLTEAAMTFAFELDHAGADAAAIREVHRDESEETQHTGMLFSIYDTEQRLVIGDQRLGVPTTYGCENINQNTLRACRTRSATGLSAVVGAAHTTVLPMLAGAALTSALLAAALAWIASRPISRLVVTPLTKLRERIAELEVVAISQAQLGPPDGVHEVDALRNTIAQLITRVERALGLAHRFAANAAHELRTPLTSVRAGLELLSENIHDPALKEDATRAEQKLAELSVLVERLLILSVPARSPEDAHELVSIRDLLEDTIEALPRADVPRVTLSEQDALIRGDAALLATMIANAIANGLKFGKHVSTLLLVSETEIVIQIDDDGPGIAPAEREPVFEPLFRSPDALRRRIPGHGLGLALIRHIAQTHQGSAAFVNKPGSGARLEIRLPVAQDTSAA
jgi:two-component system, OmpR family, sensor kinase